MEVQVQVHLLVGLTILSVVGRIKYHLYLLARVIVAWWEFLVALQGLVITWVV